MLSKKIIGLFLLTNAVLLFDACDKSEKVEIYSNKYKEKIYFIHYLWGIGDEITIISLKKDFSYPGDIKDNYSCRDYGAFFYKFMNDTLYIYGNHFLPPEKNDFKTPINFIFINIFEYKELREKKAYLEKQLTVFPPSFIKVFEHDDSIENK